MTEWREVVALLHGSREAGRIAAETLADYRLSSESSTMAISEVFRGMKLGNNRLIQKVAK